MRRLYLTRAEVKMKINFVFARTILLAATLAGVVAIVGGAFAPAALGAVAQIAGAALVLVQPLLGGPPRPPLRARTVHTDAGAVTPLPALALVPASEGGAWGPATVVGWQPPIAVADEKRTLRA